MPRGSKASYTHKRKETARRAWTSVDKQTGGGKKSGSDRGKRVGRGRA